MKMSQALPPGQTAGAGRFTLLKLLGRGGLGEAWLAQDGRLNEQSALKFLPPEIHQDAAALDELQRETRQSRQLSHPPILRIQDLHPAGGEDPFISLEYVDGPHLGSLRVQPPGPFLSWECSRPLVEQLCAASPS
jgi:serine/threonine protein kinase